MADRKRKYDRAVFADDPGDQRKRTVFPVPAVLLFAAVVVAGMLLRESAMETDFVRKNLPPCAGHLFGTDRMGRDMLARTLAGLSYSILLGLLSSAVSAGIALFLAFLSSLGKAADAAVTWLTDLMMGVPDMILLVLISCAMGKGFAGVAAGVALTHWPGLCRLLRAEILQQTESLWAGIARKLGKSRWYIARTHFLPHLLPQLLVGLTLQFPHAVLHEAGITFLGFGLPPDEPAIGIILSESMAYLSTGKWWLALFPGLALMLTVVFFERMGNALRAAVNPSEVHLVK